MNCLMPFDAENVSFMVWIDVDLFESFMFSQVSSFLRSSVFDCLESVFLSDEFFSPENNII